MKRKILYLFLSGIFIFAKGYAFSETLTWEECVREAREKNPQLISAREKVNQALSNKIITKSSLFPHITGNISGRTSNLSNSYSWGVTGSLLLFDGFKILSDLSSAEENIKSAEYSYQSISSDVRLSLRKAFVELWKAQELLGTTEDIATRRRKNLQLVRLRYEAGREHKGSLLTAEANLSQAEFEVAQARRDLQLAQRKLLKELGREEASPVTVRGDFAIKTSLQQEPDFELLSRRHPQLKTITSKKESARFNLISARRNLYPEISASARVGASSTEWPPNNNEWSVGIGLSFPIFEGRNRLAQIERQNAQLKQLEADEKNQKESVLLTLEEAWKELQDAVERIEVQKKYLLAAEERAKIAQAQYTSGLISFDNWTIIEDELVKAKKTFLDAQVNGLIAEARWIQAKGGTLDEE